MLYSINVNNTVQSFDLNRVYGAMDRCTAVVVGGEDKDVFLKELNASEPIVNNKVIYKKFVKNNAHRETHYIECGYVSHGEQRIFTIAGI